MRNRNHFMALAEANHLITELLCVIAREKAGTDIHMRKELQTALSEADGNEVELLQKLKSIYYDVDIHRK